MTKTNPHFENVREILETPVANSQYATQTKKAHLWQLLLEAERDDDTAKLLTVIAGWCRDKGAKEVACKLRVRLAEYGP